MGSGIRNSGIVSARGERAPYFFAGWFNGAQPVISEPGNKSIILSLILVPLVVEKGLWTEIIVEGPILDAVGIICVVINISAFDLSPGFFYLGSKW